MIALEQRILGLAGLVTVLACGGGGGGGGGGTPTEPNEPPLPTAAAVTTGNSLPPRFIPATTTIGVGGTVTWRNGSPAPIEHDVISKTGAFAPSPRLNPGETFQVTFAEAGVFGYRCSVHPGMEGTVTVR